MRIHRIDATYPGDDVPFAGDWAEDVAGAITFFAVTQGFCKMLKQRLADAGWEFDCYEEEIGDLEQFQRERLTNLPWPILATSRILELAADPLVAAKHRLEEIRNHQREKEGTA